MTQLFGRRSVSRPGSSPGTLQAPAGHTAQPTAVTVIAYGPELCEERSIASPDELAPYRDRPGVTWVNVTGLADLEQIERIGALFGLHPLALEDVVNVGQRPKTEDYDDHRYVVMKLLHAGAGVEVEQVSLFFGRRFVITFQEHSGDAFDGVRDRIRKGRPRIRGAGGDYLAYALIDALVDQYFPLLEDFGERLEELEEELVENPTPKTLHQIYRARRQLLLLRRAAWPQREVISGLERDESGLVGRETKVFLRDCYDHTVQALDIIETYRELAAGMLDVYLSSISNRMNEVMKVLTIMATIFIPLTFIAGIYGMNFDPQASGWNMPELEWAFGYPAALAMMAAVGLGLVFFFRRKGWL
jgi:magnesium transporter